MADTTNFGWTKPTVGGDSGSWGTILNAALDAIDADIHQALDDLDTDLSAEIAAVGVTADAALPKAGGTLTGIVITPGFSFTPQGDLTTIRTETVELGDDGERVRLVRVDADGLSIEPGDVNTGYVEYRLVIHKTNSSGAMRWSSDIHWASALPGPQPVEGEIMVVTLFTVDAGATWYGYTNPGTIPSAT